VSRIDDLIQELCPDGVERRPLGSLGKRNKGTAITASKMKAIGGGGPIRVFAGGQTVADVAEDAIPATDVVRVPSIIVKSRGHIGFSYYERPFTHKTELWSYTIDVAGVDQKFIYYYLLTQIDNLQALARATSVKLPQLSVRDTDTLRVPVPPLEVQREIVRVLDKFTQLEAELEAELEARRVQYGHYREAVLEFAHAPRASLGDLAGHGFITDGDWVESKDQDPSGEVRLTQLADVGVDVFRDRSDRWMREDQASRLNCTLLMPGDILVARMPDPIGRACEVPDNIGRAVTVVDVAVLRLRRDDVNPRYVMYALNGSVAYRQILSHQTGGTRQRISRRNLEKIQIPLPSRPKQDEVVAKLDRMHSLVNDISIGLPAELAARRKQYEYYRDRLLTFKEVV